MGYTPPDITEELYQHLTPADAFMLRGLVAKWNGIASNCLRTGSPIVIQAVTENMTVEEIFQQNLAKYEDVPTPAQDAVFDRLMSNVQDAVVRAFATPESELTGDPTRGAEMRLAAQRDRCPELSAADHNRKLILKLIFSRGAMSILELTSEIQRLKPNVTRKAVAADVWRLKHANHIVKLNVGRATSWRLADNFHEYDLA